MIFIPYKLDITLYRVPYFTIAICCICIFTFWSQVQSHSSFGERIARYCSSTQDPNLAAILRRLETRDSEAACAKVFMALRNAKDAPALINQYALRASDIKFYPDAEKNLDYIASKLSFGFSDFEVQVPQQLTQELAYQPGQFSFTRMISSIFAHADLSHLLGNLFFFYIFASCVEGALGFIRFTLSIMLMAIMSSLAYIYSASSGAGLPSIGLSGVAMGMMALLTTMVPKAKIWCFFWFLLFIRRFTIPVILVALWYVGWNIYDLNHDDGSTGINYMAHVSGALTGITLGIFFHLFARERLDALSEAAAE